MKVFVLCLLLSMALESFGFRNTLLSQKSRTVVCKLSTADKLLSQEQNDDYESVIASSISKLMKARDRSNEVEPMSVLEALVTLERTLPKQNKVDEGQTNAELLSNLKGAWRLVFTSGTVDFQKKIGKINYFPVKAVQSFDTDNWRITNGVYVGTFPLLKFFGEFSWNVKMKKLEFDFDRIQVLGLGFNIPKPDESKKKKGQAKPFFKWIHADAEIATARGGSGGLALWQRDPEMAAILFAK